MKYEFQLMNLPESLKDMNTTSLQSLADDIRSFLLESISKTGGHLASNLGVVELTIALHKVFDSPRDKIVWDVGHQSYVHKILTGRSEGFSSLRQCKGMSGFPKRRESIHDVYETGHSSTSISAAMGIATSNRINGVKGESIAVIGDGSMTGGLVYEALNHLGESKEKVIIILNDNAMSISQNTGGLSRHLTELRASKSYLRLKRKSKNILSKLPLIGKVSIKAIHKIKEQIKFFFINDGILFESLGINYIGPIDGHNIDEVVDGLQSAKNMEEPVILHVLTKKGKGYAIAEKNASKYHGVGPFDLATGQSKKSDGISYSEIFGMAALKCADKDDKIVAITAAMGDATGLSPFANKYPDRFFDVGIAEAHAVNYAAGLASNGLKPLVAIYSTFIQRAFDQIIIDVALQNLPVVFALDRAGVVGADGETHHGVFDISFLSAIPNLTVLAPSNGYELYHMIEYAFTLNSPCVVRYPRGSVSFDINSINSEDLFSAHNERLNEIEVYNQTFACNNSDIIDIKTSKNKTNETPKKIDIWAVGNMLDNAIGAYKILSEQGINVGIVKVNCIKPFDEDIVDYGCDTIVIVEDNIVRGGFGEHIAAMLNGRLNVIPIGWPDKFIEHATQNELYDMYGLSPEKIAERILKSIEEAA